MLFGDFSDTLLCKRSGDCFMHRGVLLIGNEKEVMFEVNKILIVEADFRMAERLCRSISDTQTLARSCGTLEAAKALLKREAYQMLIVDTELPDGTGYDIVCGREPGTCGPGKPDIILMIPNDRMPEMSEHDEQGIADYITKPFNTAVLKAKVYTQFRRRQKESSIHASERFDAIGSGSAVSIGGGHRVVIDDYVFNFDAGEYSIAGRKVRLNRIEQCLLRNLVENKGIVLKKKALMDKLRSESNVYADEKTLAETVRILRDKLYAGDYIKTIYAIGYIWRTAEEKERS